MAVDSPSLNPRNRLLARSDSTRFFANSRGAMSFTYGFTFASILFMLFFVLTPTTYQSARRYHFSKVFSHIFNSSSSSVNSPSPPPSTSSTTPHHSTNKEVNTSTFSSNKDADHHRSQISRKEGSGLVPKDSNNNQKEDHNGVQVNPPSASIEPQQQIQMAFPPLGSPDAGEGTSSQNVMQQQQQQRQQLQGEQHSMELMGNNNVCDMFEGSWVRDDSYPLYRPGSCPHIDEPFNCFLNGRSDNMYEKFRWQPKNCNMPRLNAKDMLEMLRGKRLVFVGDSLNRNMWESLVCVLRNSVEDKSRIFEASGREEYRTEDSYSFIFTDYNCSIEFVRSPFLVQEWESPDRKGSRKETLRLDVVERSCDKYKNADVLIFNTGHWWTHEKRMEGKEYYQEGNHIHGQMNVEEAIHKALLTWSQWVDANIDPKKTVVFFRGYSPSHFRGGEWNSGGQCENETEPMKDESDLSENPPMMRTIESVIKGMKTPVFYLNITKMTDFRRDAHPSMYRNMNMTEETKRFMLTHQDCSHWCLPGVPDLWNELVYAHLLHTLKRNKGNPQT